MTFEDPVFVTYVVAATLMILKLMGQGWITVYRMMKIGRRFPQPRRRRRGSGESQTPPGSARPR